MPAYLPAYLLTCLPAFFSVCCVHAYLWHVADVGTARRRFYLLGGQRSLAGFWLLSLVEAAPKAPTPALRLAAVGLVGQ